MARPSIVLNNDVVTEILLRLPIRSLLRFKTVSKLWRDVIDSPSFRSSHLHKQAANNNEDYGKVLVVVKFSYVVRDHLPELSIVLPDNGKSNSDFPAFREFFNDQPNNGLSIVGAANGLICIYRHYLFSKLDGVIAVCNPSLGEIRKLPEYSPPFSFSCCRTCNLGRHVGIGFDKVSQDYKVVQFLSCSHHRRRHASVYSRVTNSWRELAGGGGNNINLDDLQSIQRHIKSSCMNDSFAHWRVANRVHDEWNREDLILSFDMKNEVFRTFEIPSIYQAGLGIWDIFATEKSFVLFTYPDLEILSIFEASFEGNKTCWNFVANVKKVGDVVLRPIALWRSDCVILESQSGKWVLCTYDFRAEKEMDVEELPFEMDAIDSNDIFKVFQYKGSFISP